MKTIKDLKIKNKKVIIRCDFNVPIKNGKITDDTRIKESLETINYAIENDAKVILLSHLGRIKEEKDLEKYDMKIVAKRLEKLLRKKITFVNETRGKAVKEAVSNLKSKDVLLIQNTRYEDLDGKKESKNAPELGKYWASLGDVFVNDAFGTIHREHASNVGIAQNLPSAVGFLVEKELNVLSSLKKVEKPFIIILGGAKVKDKIGVIKSLVKKADYILIGGGMAYTFLQSDGFSVGNSIVDTESLDFCKEMLDKYGEKIILPVDCIATTEYKDTIIHRTRLISEIDQDEMGLDIGPNTIELFKNYLKEAKTVLWNGPIGVYEFSHFKEGTEKILKYLTKNKIKTILGGGDIVAAATATKQKNKVYHASTGGGATLEYLEGKKLPGLEIIK